MVTNVLYSYSHDYGVNPLVGGAIVMVIMFILYVGIRPR